MLVTDFVREIPQLPHFLKSYPRSGRIVHVRLIISAPFDSLRKTAAKIYHARPYWTGAGNASLCLNTLDARNGQ